MDIAEWRQKVDLLDREMVKLINQRASVAHEIGRLKRESGMAIYEPVREKAVLANVQDANQGPLSDHDIVSIFERIMDMMRKIQQEEIAPESPE